MNVADRIVTQTPLREIWKGDTILQIKRNRYLTKREVKNLLKKGALEFVIADVGKTLEWIKIDNCFVFWKSEVVSHIPENYEKINLNDFSDGYAFIASEWVWKEQSPIILLEKIH